MRVTWQAITRDWGGISIWPTKISVERRSHNFLFAVWIIRTFTVIFTTHFAYSKKKYFHLTRAQFCDKNLNFGEEFPSNWNCKLKTFSGKVPGRLCCWRQLFTPFWEENYVLMMTSSYGNIFCITGPLCTEFTGHWWIPITKASNMELWWFLWSVLKQTVE